jgi:ribonuclease HI
MAKKCKYYVVWEGYQPGVYDNWEDAAEQVQNFPGARFKSFNSQIEAVRAFRGDDSEELKALITHIKAPAVEINLGQFPEIDRTAWAVDAACAGNPGSMEYRGVELSTGKVIFHAGPFVHGTNNIGEYLAIVHALALMEQRGEAHAIYSDSRTALSWIRRGHSRSQLKVTDDTLPVLNLLSRADRWLATHAFRVKIMKWETEVWGEIPADFARK